MANFFAELKRRHIYRVAAAYAVVAWVLLQLINNVAPILDLPPWVARAFLLLLVIGFPVALMFAWIQQLAPAPAVPVQAVTGKSNRKPAGLWSFLRRRFDKSGGSAASQGAVTHPVVSPTPSASISIAVLPFANMSGDAGQEFFSDGMTEEITAALAKVSGLMVIGRTSAFTFKGQNKDLRAIGQALGTTHLVEGSVRKAGDRVRITAQLIRADNGVHLWTESYDHQLTDIFAVQEDIAQAVAGALCVPLGLKQGERLISNRTKDVESYDQYLRAKAMVRARGLKPLIDAAGLLEQVVARDPNFAPAWAMLGLACALTPNYYPAWFCGSVEELRSIVDEALPRAESAARRAIQLDPNHADGHLSLGVTQDRRGKFLHAEELYLKALTLDSNNPDALHAHSLLLAGVGRLKEALAIRRHLQALEPFVPVFNWNTANVLALNGQLDDAITMIKALPTGVGRSDLARSYAAMGRYGEAADALLEIPSGNYPSEIVKEAARLLRTAPAKVDLPQSTPRLGFLNFVYLHIGASDRALAFYEGNVQAGYLISASVALLWHPSYAPLRKTERFKAFVRKAALVDYWRKRGWPDLCRPTSADDFVCD